MDNFVLEPIADVERVGNNVLSSLFLFVSFWFLFEEALFILYFIPPSYVGPVGCVGIVE